MKKIKIIFVLTIVFALKLCIAQDLQIKDGWYYVDGQKYFIKAIGYETNSRPGHLPWIYKFDADLIRHDLNNIKNAGFNTIRTWAALTEEELKLVDESGLKILFGIYVDNAGDFKSESFRLSTLDQINKVLSYSQKYKCIIGYLIMNEPQVDQIYNAGAQNIYDFWKSVVDLIHQKHSGVPVSFSSALTGDFISMDLFDFASYNAYIYSPVTLSDAPGYSAYLNYLKNNRAPGKPFVITEFGLSVSPGTPSAKYSYGRNTLTQQTDGDLLMYRNLIDAGAQGGAVFQYHDGWWKAGNEFVHDPTAEEWFGLFEFADLNDTLGTPRPVWSAFTSYNKAIITEPRNEEIYSGQIPVEIFTTGDVHSFSVLINDSTVLNQDITSNYFNGRIPLDLKEQVKDVSLIFNFLNADGVKVKSETISVLCSMDKLQLPEIKMQVAPANLNPGGKNTLIMEVTNNPLFTIEDNKVDYVAHPHIGFDDGTAKHKVIALSDNKFVFWDSFDIHNETKVTTFGAGFTIRYGNFTKRIFTQQILTNGTWADPIKATDKVSTAVTNEDNGAIPVSFSLKQNYPNPFNPGTVIKYQIASACFVYLKIYDILGREKATLVNEIKQPGTYDTYVSTSMTDLSSGIYFYTLKAGGFSETKKMVIVR